LASNFIIFKNRLKVFEAWQLELIVIGLVSVAAPRFSIGLPRFRKLSTVESGPTVLSSPQRKIN